MVTKHIEPYDIITNVIFEDVGLIAFALDCEILTKSETAGHVYDIDALIIMSSEDVPKLMKARKRRINHIVITSTERFGMIAFSGQVRRVWSAYYDELEIKLGHNLDGLSAFGVHMESTDLVELHEPWEYS